QAASCKLQAASCKLQANQRAGWRPNPAKLFLAAYGLRLEAAFSTLAPPGGSVKRDPPYDPQIPSGSFLQLMACGLKLLYSTLARPVDR
ncbi:hypothetical protein, partial [Pseudomonas lopnurensis]|uniref:hypothetical protein n=1 Tax=Pseudomonas lopnurensis TaxID=1477517 RepID=UPI001A9C6B6C